MSEKEFTFGSLTDLWGEVIGKKSQPEIASSFSSFKMPVWPIVYQKKNINMFDMAIRLMSKHPVITGLFTTQGWYDLDLAFKNPTQIHAQVKIWRETIPNGKDKPVIELWPDPYLGRRCYQASIVMEQTTEWVPKKEKVIVDGKEIERNKKKIVDGKEVDDNEKIDCVDKNGNPILKFGDLSLHRKGKGANITLYINTFQLPKETFEYDNAGNVVKKEEDVHYIFNKTKGVIWNPDIIARVEEVEKIFVAYNELMAKKDPKRVLSKVDCFIVTSEVIPPKKVSAYSVHECVIDHIHFLVD
jgi:hypothetical protein